METSKAHASASLMSAMLQSMVPQADVYAYEKQFVAVARSVWNGAFDPFSLLDTFPDTWRIYWRGKGSCETMVGVGSVLVLQRLPAFKDTEASLCSENFYGGLPFSAEENKDEPFAQSFFVLPQWEWRHEDGVTSFHWRRMYATQPCAEQIQADWSEDIAQIKGRLSDAPAQSLSACEQVQDSPSRSEWDVMIAQAQQEMMAGRLAKVVVSRRKHLQMAAPVAAGALLSALNELNEPSFLFAWITPENAAFVGRSPERLLAWEGRSLHVDAIAGTRRREKDAQSDSAHADDLRASGKELSEHRFVADYVSDLLARFCESFRQAEHESLLRLHHVQHMITRFEGLLREDVPATQVLHALHPTPAVGGTPRQEALDFLEQYEPFTRGWFAGPVGWLSGFAGDFAIGIRSAVIQGAKAAIYAGAGIVADSRASDEWDETEAKMKNFLNVFGTVHLTS